LDTLLAFAYLAYERDYIKPELHLNNNISESESFLEIREARHPLAELFLSGNNYISNDIISGLLFFDFSSISMIKE
jgi:DNA mismatch repair ATPase MutS